MKPKGTKRGQLRYYLHAAFREYRERGSRRAWNRFWAGRWFWSAGRLGPIPMFYLADYWRDA